MLFILDYNQNTVGVASNSNPFSLPYYNDLHTENLDGVNSYEFQVPSDHSDSSLIEVEGHIILTNLDGEQQLFTVKEVADSTDSGKKVKSIYCEETAISELLSDVQRPITLTAVTLEQAVQNVLSNTSGWILNDVPYTESYDVELTEYTTILEALRTICLQYSKEIYFTVKLRGTQIVEKQINIVDERGTQTGVRFDYSYDLKGVSRTENSSNVVTALVGVGKGDNASVRVNLSSEPAFVDGDFYKDAGTDWIGSDSALQRWGKNGRHRFGVFIDDEADTPAELKRRTLKELEKRITPDLTYSASVATLERLTGYDAKKTRLGDTVVVNDKSFEPPIVINGRVVETKRSYTRNDQDEINLGKYKPITLSANTMIKDLQNIVSKNEAQWNTVPAEVQQQIQDIDNRTGTIQIIETVIASEDFTSIMSDKANAEDISDMATGEQLTASEGRVTQYIDGRIDGEGGVIESINAVSSELEKTANSIDARFSSSGGVNLLKNSIGYADTQFWTMMGGKFSTIQNQELEQLGFGSGFYKDLADGTSWMEQTVNVTPNKKHSISFWLKKTIDNLTGGHAGVDIWINGEKIAFIGKGSGTGVTTGWELGLFTFETPYSEITVRVTAGDNAEATITGLMLNVGQDAFQWQHHPEEIYNTNIQMNLNGIKVINSVTKGYTIMSDQEFSGYAEVLDDNNQPFMERVFTLNDDVTEVSKLSSEKEINMQSIRTIHIDGNGSKGWAFIANE